MYLSYNIIKELVSKIQMSKSKFSIKFKVQNLKIYYLDFGFDLSLELCHL